MDGTILQALAARRAALGDALPRVGLFVLDETDPESLRRTLDRIPKELDGWLAEVVVLCPEHGPAPAADGLAPGRGFALRVHRDLQGADPGGARKAALEYALRRGFDWCLVLRGDGRHPPEKLPELLHAALHQPEGLVLASRLVHKLETWRAGMPAARLAAHVLSTAFQNRMLGLRLDDYHSGFRLYPRRLLESVPFHLNADDPAFDLQIVIQARALGVPIHEVPVVPAWKEYASDANGLAYVLRACLHAADYRLHQLHLTRRGRYFVDQGVHYTLKRSRTGSHMQIVDAIRPDTRVLDLGCSQGLLARPLREKNVRIVGVDRGAPERRSAALEAYHERDLEDSLELPVGREFDYVVISDVIEHLRNRNQLLRGARRYLKPDGRLIVSTPNIALWFYRLSLLVGRFEYGPRGVLDETHVHLYTGASFRREVERAGFRVVHRRVTALPFEVVFRSTGRSRLMRGVAAAYHGLARAWPSMFAYQNILEATITTLDDDATAH